VTLGFGSWPGTHQLWRISSSRSEATLGEVARRAGGGNSAAVPNRLVTWR
jgi:hypothetical protein